MYNACGVRPSQGVSDLHGRFQRLIQTQSSAAQELVQSLAFDILHGDIVQPILLIDVVNGDDVGMVQRRGGFGLLHESPFALGVSDFA